MFDKYITGRAGLGVRISSNCMSCITVDNYKKITVCVLLREHPKLNSIMPWSEVPFDPVLNCNVMKMKPSQQDSQDNSNNYGIPHRKLT